MLLKFFVEEALERISDILNYQQDAEEINTLIGDKLVTKLQNVQDELEELNHSLNFE